jgi:Domain of unknown function (DUF4082)
MAVYTLFGQQATGSALTADAAGYTMGVQFSVSRAGTLTGIWFYSAAGAVELPQHIALYQVSGQVLIVSQVPAWSGVAGSGWVRASFTNPPALTAGTAYKACVHDASGNSFYSTTAHYWDTGAGSGGITSGPLSAPNNAGGDGGQDTFNSPSVAVTYPGTSFNASNYWIDPEVTVSSTVTGDDDVPWHIRSMA